MWRMLKINVVCAASLTASRSYTDSHLTRENILCQCKKWTGTDGLRVIETTYNGSHNFPVLLPLPPSFVDCFTHLVSSVPIVWIHRCSLFNAIPAHCCCQKRLRLTGSPVVRRKVSQDEKKGGGKRKEEKKGSSVFPTNLKSLETVFILIHHTLYQWIPKNHCLMSWNEG